MADIRVEVQFEDGSFTTGIWRAGRSLSQFKEELKQVNPHFAKLDKAGKSALLSIQKTTDASASLGKTMRNVAIMAGGVAVAFHAITGASNSIIGNIVRVNAEMERLHYQLAGLSTASTGAEAMKEAAGQIDTLRRMAKELPFSIGMMSNAMVKMKAAGLDPMNGSLHALLDGMAAFGATDEQVNRVTVALTQMQGKGVLSMEELRQQLGESMPSAMRLMARSMGVSVGELTKLVATGTVDSRKALDKFFKEVQRTYGGSGKKMMETFSGQVSKINTNLNELITKGPMKEVFDRLKEGMGDFAQFLTTDKAREMTGVLAESFNQVLDLIKAIASEVRSMMGPIKKVVDYMPQILGGMALMMGGKMFIGLMTKISLSLAAIGAAGNRMKKSVVESIAALQLTAGAASQAISQSARAATGASVGSALAETGRGLGMMTSTARTTLTSVAAVGGRLLGLLGPIGLGLGLVAPLVLDIGKGFLSWVTGAQKAKEGVEAVRDTAYGLAMDEWEREHERLLAARKKAENDHDTYFQNFGKSNAAHLIALERANNAVHAHVASRKAVMEKAGADDIHALVSGVTKGTEDRLREASRAYDHAVDSADKILNDRIANQGISGESTKKIYDDYHKALTEAKKEFYDKQLDDQTQLIDRLREDVAKGLLPQAVLTALIEARDKLKAERDAAMKEQYGVDRVNAPESDEKKAERLAKRIEDQREKVAELSAELNGASGAVGKLFYQLKRGDFGKLSEATKEMEDLHNELLQTAIAAEALERVLKAGEDANKNIDSIYENLREENLKLKAILEGVDVDNALAFEKFKLANGEIDLMVGTPEDVVKRALESVTQGLGITIGKFGELSTELKDNAFGTESVRRINEVRNALVGVQNAASGVSEAIGGIDFSNMGDIGSVGLGGAPRVVKAVDNGILDLIAGPESGGDYNATLANGAFTGGKRDLTSMTLAQIRQLQAQMLKHPGNHYNSSALGRYQIVGKTLQSLMDRHNLDPNAKFDEKMQDFLGAQLALETGGNVTRLRGVWEGLKHVSGGKIADAWDASFGSGGPTRTRAALGYNAPVRGGGPTAPGPFADQTRSIIDSRVDYSTTLEAAEGVDRENKALEKNVSLYKLQEDARARREALSKGAGVEGLGTWETRFLEDLAHGKFGDLGAGEVAKLRQEFAELDKAEQKRRDDQRDSKKLTEEQAEMEAQLAEIQRERLEIMSQVADRNFKGTSSDMKKLEENERKTLAIAERLYGVEDKRYKAIQERFAGMRGAQQSVESAQALLELTRAADDEERNAITDARLARRAAFEERVKELAALRDQAIRDGANVAAAQMAYDRAVAAAKKQLLEQDKTQLQRNLDEMGNFARNVNNTVAEIPSQLSDALYKAASGESGAFQALGNAFREALARNFTDKAAQLIMEPFVKILEGDGSEGGGAGGWLSKLLGLNNEEGLLAGLKGQLGGLFKGIGSWIMKLFSKSGTVGVKHTGGVVGAGGGWGRSASVANFVGAPKYHTGGLVGAPAFRKGLLPSEVPIIAQRGEGVFTPEQMKALGPAGGTSNAISINAPITVNANGGTPEQNADLAKQMARESEVMLRGLVQQEMVRQMRPGGMLR